MELQNNPYQPPTTEQPFARPVDAESAQLATRGARLGAAFVDGLLILAVMVPLQWSMGVFNDYAAYSKNYLSVAMWTVGGFAITLAVNGYFLATRAQSVGKAVLGIKIVTMDGQNAPFARIVGRRILPISAVSMVPGIGGLLALVDCLAIFRKDQRCVHDLIADTRVVRA